MFGMFGRKATESSNCKPEPGLLQPRINPNKCEGKEDCLRVCPYDVFEIRKLTDQERSTLSFIGRIKSTVHGGKQAFVVRGADCHACGLCVSACPEKAIKLERAPSGP